MSFGKMKVKIDLVKKSIEKDSAGFVNPSYETLASVRAYREMRHGGGNWERWANMALFADVAVMYRFRKIPGLEVTAKHFISDGGRIYNIVNAENVRGRSMYVEVLAETQEGSVK